MMDDFVELLVKKKNTGSDIFLKVLIVLGAIILSLLLFMLSATVQFIGFILFLLIAGVIYGSWLLIISFNVEYEYIVTNGEMDIDKITAKRRRKRLITVNFKDIDIMAPVNGDHKNECKNQSVQKTIEAAAELDAKDTYFIIARHKKFGLVRILFTPDERIIKSAKLASPRKVFIV